MKTRRLQVAEPAELLKFLLAKLPERSRTSVKSLLTHGQVAVDGELVTQFNHPLGAGQMVEIGLGGAVEKTGGMRIIFEDADLIVIEKRAGLLSIASDDEKEKTAYSCLSAHVKKASPRNQIFVVHRLDRETSGLMMFAKNQAMQKALQATWHETVGERTYIAVVEGRVLNPCGTITSWLTESKSLIMRSSSTPNEGKKAITRYRVLQTCPLYSLLKLNLETGRKNQIRVQLQALGHPVVGDEKYGAHSNPIRRLGLHAKVLSFRHPATGETLRFESAVPGQFLSLFGG